MKTKHEKLKDLLKNSLDILDSSQSTLIKSYEKCRKIGLKDEYTFEELESFDSLTSKFARTSDIFTQKVLVTLFKVLREEGETFLDRANLAEALSLITSADDMVSIRDIRNQISHEYKQERIEELFEAVFDIMDTLVASLEKTKNYIVEKEILDVEK